MDGLDAKIVDQEVQGALKFQLSPQDLDLSADHIHHLTWEVRMPQQHCRTQENSKHSVHQAVLLRLGASNDRGGLGLHHLNAQSDECTIGIRARGFWASHL